MRNSRRSNQFYRVELLEPRLLLAADWLAGLAPAWSADGEAQTPHSDLGDYLAERNESGFDSRLPLALPGTLNLNALLGLQSQQDAAEDLTLPVFGSDSVDSTRHELVIIDAGVEGYEELVADFESRNGGNTLYEVYVLQAGADGIRALSDILAGYSDLDAVHIVSHGSDGGIQLGDSRLDTSSIDSYAETIRGWSGALGEDADLLVYGCNLAATETGQSLVASLSALTQADVAASTDATGQVLLGGDWTFEHSLGDIDSQVAFSTQIQSGWSGVLLTPVANDDVYGVNQDMTLRVNALLGLLANDTDADLDPLTLRLLTGPSNGSLTLNPIGLTNLLNLSMNVSSDTFVSWSPDGSQLAFSSDQDGDYEIYVINADGTGLQQLTTSGSSERQPVWSPDGTQILYRSDSDGTFDIWVMDANGGNPLRLTTGAASDGASEKDAVWSPDGTRIVYVMDLAQDSIYVMNADGSNPQPLTSPAARDFAPEWSPDGSSIVFTSDRNGNDEIYVMDADGNNVNRLTTNATAEAAPSWSPDGSKILFHSNADGDFELYAMDADGSNVTQLTYNSFADRRAVWSPDGTQIAFQTDRDGNNEIYVADIVSDGAFSYTPDPGFTGVDSFTYVVSDGTTESAAATVTLNVAGDSDGDGLWDHEEDPNTDLDNDPSTNPVDTDGDSIPDYLDDDDDGDGILTADENADPNGDGDPRDGIDSDRDGVPEYLDLPTGVSDGTVGDEMKISDLVGGLAATLDNTDAFGFAVASIGDLNGDGINDIVVGAPFDDDGGTDRGAVYVLFLNADGTVSSEVKISDTTGGLMESLDDGDRFGRSVASIGDLDGDGVNDIVVGTGLDDDGGIDSGAVYVLFLNANGTVKAEQKISDIAGGLGLTLDTGGRFGTSVAGIGDIDGDGINDIAVGAFNNGDGGAGRGAVYVLSLNADGTVKSEQKISDTAGGLMAALGNNDYFGFSVAGIGDVDGDGINDIAVGARNDDDGGTDRGDDDGGTDRGAVYVLLLNADGTVRAEQKISDTAGGLMATLDDVDHFGFSVGGIGDVDGDGIVDIAVGATADDDGGTDRGAVYVLFLNADGTVKGEQKISDTEGGLMAPLDDSDNFGTSVGGIGDLDGDGTIDIVVGAYADDDGGTNRGAVHVLFGAKANSAPTATNLNQTLPYLEEAFSVALGDIVVTDSDAGDTITVTLTLSDMAAGSLSAASGNGETYAAGTGVWTITGTVAQVNAALADVSFSPAANYAADSTISVHIEDLAGEGPADGLIALDVTPVNDQPGFTIAGDQNELEDSGAHTVVGFATALPGGGTDESGQTFAYTVSSDNPGLFLVGPSIDANGTLTYTLNPNATGTARVTVSVTDSGGTANGGVDTSADQTFDIVVGAVNDVPSFSTLGDQNELEDSGAHTVAGFATALPGGGTDESGQTFSYTVSSDNPGLFLVGPSIDANGTLTYTLNPNATGTARVTVSVTDSGGTANGGVDTSADQTFDIVVGAVNDVPSFSTLGDQNELEDSGAHTVAGFATALPGGGTDESGQTFSYTVSSDNPGLFLVGPSIDANGTLTYTLNPNATGTARVTVSVTDSGGTANGGVDTSADQTFDIVVGAVNDVPSFSTLGDQNELEDSGAHTVAGFATALPGGGTDESGQTFSYTVSSDNPGLFLVGPSIDANGTLTYTLNPNATGTATVTVSVTDSGGTANGGVDTSADQTFDIVVGAVNDVPTFSTLGDQNELEDSGAHTVAGFATALPGGGTDESGQTFSYTVSSDNPGLFLVGPSIDANGTLTYTLNANATGTATVTVSVTDSGGTGNGGVDTSADQTFDIVVVPVSNSPIATNLNQNLSYLEDGGSVPLIDIMVTDGDIGDMITATLTLSDPGAGTLTFGSGNGESYSAVTGVWTVTGTVAQVNAALAAVAFTPATDGAGDITITTHIEDLAGQGPTDGLITLSSTAVNDAPTVTTLGDQAELEDSGSHTVVGFATALPGGGSDESGQTFSYIVSSDNPGLFLVGPSIDANGTLTYTLNPNATGTATVTVSVTDSGGTANGGVDTSANQTFDIVVGAVNDAPSFSMLGDQNEFEDSGSHTVTGFAAALPGGGTDESRQTFTYTVSSDNPGLFLVGPSIDANGTLTYTLNAGVSGTARITVMVTDSGGTTNGGGNESASQAFDIVVTPLDSVPAATNLNQMHLYLEDSGPIGLHDILVSVGGTSGVVTATLTLSDTTTGLLSANSGNGEIYTSTTGVWTITGTVAQVNAALAAVSFVPVSDNDVSTTLSTHIENASGQGPVDGLITLSVTPVNDPPSGVDGVVGITGNSVYVFTMANFGYSDLVEGDAVLAVQITSLPSWTGTLINNGVIVSVGDIINATDINAGHLHFVSASGFDHALFGTITFRVQDAGGTTAGGMDFDPNEKQLTIVVNESSDFTTGTGADDLSQAGPHEIDQSSVQILQHDQAPTNSNFAADQYQMRLTDTRVTALAGPDRLAPAPAEISATAVADTSTLVGFPVFQTLVRSFDGAGDVSVVPEPQIPVIERSGDNRQLLASSSDDIKSGLEQMRDAVADDNASGRFILSRSAGAVLGLSVGYVSWLLRGGVLLSSVLSSLPVWRFVDPLPVFAREQRDEDHDDESLAGIVQSGSANDDHNTQIARDKTLGHLSRQPQSPNSAS